MKAIVSVFAKDQKGIIAYVTQILADNGINILDIRFREKISSIRCIRSEVGL